MSRLEGPNNPGNGRSPINDLSLLGPISQRSTIHHPILTNAELWVLCLNDYLANNKLFNGMDELGKTAKEII